MSQQDAMKKKQIAAEEMNGAIADISSCSQEVLGAGRLELAHRASRKAC